MRSIKDLMDILRKEKNILVIADTVLLSATIFVGFNLAYVFLTSSWLSLHFLVALVLLGCCLFAFFINSNWDNFYD